MKSKNTRDCDAIHTSSHEITYDKKIRNKTDVIILGVCSKLNALPRLKVLCSFLFFLMRNFELPPARAATSRQVTRDAVPGINSATDAPGQEEPDSKRRPATIPPQIIWKTVRALATFVPLKCYVKVFRLRSARQSKKHLLC